jgi:hypothetical protein
MLDRFTVSSLIKSVIVLMALCITGLLSVSAWNSWGRLAVTGRILLVSEASSGLFKALHNLRSDRSATSRNLKEDAVLPSSMQTYMRDVRDAELSAMRSASVTLSEMDFSDRATLLPELNRLIDAFAVLETESWTALNKPKASRRPELGKEFMDNTAALVETLDKLSTKVAAAVNHDDPVIDQMLMIKQLAWLMRNTAGEASLLVSNGLAAGHMTPDVRQTYTKLVGGTETAWNALQTVAATTAMPPAFIQAMADAKTAYFDPQFLAQRDRLINALVNGDKPEMKANDWNPFSVQHMTSIVAVAERALDIARDYAAASTPAPSAC